MTVPIDDDGVRGLKIAIDGRELDGRPTGVGRYLRSLLRRFADHRTHSFVVYGASDLDLPVPSSNIRSRVLPPAAPLLWEQRDLARAVAADEVDVLLSPAYSCPAFTSVPRVTALHDLSFFARPEEFSFGHGLRRRMMARIAARKSRSLLACSQFTRGEIARHLGSTAADKTAVVLLGPDDDLPRGPSRSDARRFLGLADDAFYIVTVGTILRRRNVSTLVRTLAYLQTRVPGVRLGIVGENRSHPFEDLRELASTLGVASFVNLTGFATDEDIARHYAAADLAVFLSEYEGFGLPALEAMSRGVPTVVANRGSLNEMFAAGAAVVEPAQASVTETVLSLINDPRRRHELGQQGLARSRDFSWERAAAETLGVLEKAAS